MSESKAHKYAMAAFVVTLGLISVSIYYLSVYNYKLYRGEFDDKVSYIANVASELIDSEKHQLLTDESQTNSPLYEEVVAPLVKIHNAIPEITYLYTMIYDDETSYFILDSAMSPDLVTDKDLTGSVVMEEYVEHEYFRDSIAAVKRGETYVYKDLYEDEFGVLISAAAPLYDKQGKVIGLVGVDFDATYFAAYNRDFYRHVIIAFIFALVLSSLIGLLVYRRLLNAEQMQEEQFKMAVTDQLTGVYNRRYIDHAFDKAVEAYGTSNESLAVLLVDFDHFKQINDQYGHQTGDEVLTQSIERLKEELRPQDEIIRWGGEEFLILLPDTRQIVALDVAERLRKTIERNLVQIGEDLSLKITVSVGVSAMEDNEQLSEILSRVDEALYEAKASGRNCIKVG